MLHNITLSANTKRTIDARINRLNAQILIDKINIEKAANSIMVELSQKYPMYFCGNMYGIAYAYTLNKVAHYSAKHGIINVYDLLMMYATEKQENSKINPVDANKKPDTGTFGDLLEIIARASILPNYHLLNWRHISVHDIKTSDIISKKYGTIEVGHNSKTWNSATFDDYMEGDFNTVIYGIFDDYTKEQIYNFCIIGDILSAIKYVKSYSVLFHDKYQFLDFMQSLAKNGIFRIKNTSARGTIIQNDYNAGIMKKYFQAIENNIVKTMIDGEN